MIFTAVPRSHACATFALTALLSIGVGLIVGMASRTMSLREPESTGAFLPFPSAHILGVGDGLKMIDAHACTIPTQMV
jgi:hypothetical protein